MRLKLVVVAVVVLSTSLVLAACDHGDKAAGEKAAASTPTAPVADGPTPPPAGDFQSNVDLVKALYAEDGIPQDPTKIAKYFAAEFVGPMTATDDNYLDFDYRIVGQDGSADNLTVEETDGDGRNGRVLSRFTNMGAPQEIAWIVCRQSSGVIRLVDVMSTATGEDAWDLRQVLHLPARPEGC